MTCSRSDSCCSCFSRTRRLASACAAASVSAAASAARRLSACIANPCWQQDTVQCPTAGAIKSEELYYSRSVVHVSAESMLSAAACLSPSGLSALSEPCLGVSAWAVVLQQLGGAVKSAELRHSRSVVHVNRLLNSLQCLTTNSSVHGKNMTKSACSAGTPVPSQWRPSQAVTNPAYTHTHAPTHTHTHTHTHDKRVTEGASPSNSGRLVGSGLWETGLMVLEGLLLLFSSPIGQLVGALSFHCCLAGGHLLPQLHTGCCVQGILLQQPVALPRLKLPSLCNMHTLLPCGALRSSVLFLCLLFMCALLLPVFMPVVSKQELWCA